MKFKLLRGTHHEAKWDKSVKPPVDRGRTYHAGDVIETNFDLTTLNGGDPQTVKFEKVDDATPATAVDAVPVEIKSSVNTNAAAVDDTLDAMTVNELKEMAAEEEIDLGSAKSKAEILSVLRSFHAK